MRSRTTRGVSGLLMTVLAAASLLLAGPASAQAPTVTAEAGAPALGLGAFDLPAMGYVVEEFFISGTASAYRLAGAATADGHWRANAAERAPYATRIVVVRPKEARRFNGTAVVEWLNVSGGYDVPADWIMTHRELLRGGYAYVGVTAQKVGQEGGAAFVRGNMALKNADPKRYGRLSHPGDAYAFDIYSQAAAVVRAGGVLGPLTAKRVLSMGESQSAIFLTTYINAIDPLAKAYDGYLVHSRFGSAASLEGTSIWEPAGPAIPAGVRLRTDLRVPVLTVVTETDLFGPKRSGFHHARQSDNQRLRVWELPGAAHADNYTFLVGPADSGQLSPERLAALYTPTAALGGVTTQKPINAAPQQHYVTQAALRGLDLWVRTGKAPSHGAPIQTIAGPDAGDPLSFALDANGNAKGGVRTPWVDVPVARHSGLPNVGGSWGFLVGSTEPFAMERLKALYPGGRAQYLSKFDASLAAAMKSGFILEDDGPEIRAVAAAAYPVGP